MASKGRSRARCGPSVDTITGKLERATVDGPVHRFRHCPPSPGCLSRNLIYSGTAVNDGGRRRGGRRVTARPGLVHAIAYEKRCINYRWHHDGHAVTATVVQVPELPPDSFVEIEALVADGDETTGALAAVRSVLVQLGLGDDDLEDEFYVDMVRRRRAGA